MGVVQLTPTNQVTKILVPLFKSGSFQAVNVSSTTSLFIASRSDVPSIS